MGAKADLMTAERQLAVAQQICTQIALAVADIQWGAEAQCTSLTASIGVAQAQSGDTADMLLRRADAAMYLSKKLGRDRPLPSG